MGWPVLLISRLNPTTNHESRSISYFLLSYKKTPIHKPETRVNSILWDIKTGTIIQKNTQVRNWIKRLLNTFCRQAATAYLHVQVPIALQKHKIVCQRKSGYRRIYLNCASHNANSVFLDTPRAKKSSNPDASITQELKDRIFDAQSDERIDCKTCWEIAKEFKISRVNLGSVCERLKIRIKPCQLGTF